MSSIRYSIIIPMFNAEATIENCIGAILRSDLDDFELIVVNDGSTDKSATLLSENAGLKYLTHDKNRGPSAARNTGAAHASGEILVFVDADTLVRPQSLRTLVTPLEKDPMLLGTNGIFAIDGRPEGQPTDFVNTSIHFQHLSHGHRINTSFTAICALRRSAFKEMGGWDVRRQSRYADDINTRWQLPPKSILLVSDAQAEHRKKVTVKGLLKHRFNIGYHFIHSLQDNKEAFKSKPHKATLHYRYPMNTLIGFGLIGGIICPPIWIPLMGASLINNAPFMLFTLKNRNPQEAMLAAPLSLIEGVAYALGIIQGGRHRFRN